MAGPAWYEIAKKYLGVAELKGAKHNSVILGWLKRLKAWWSEDETPWCGTFAAICFKEAGLPVAKAWYRARAWGDYGIECSPQVGAILVFVRSGGGHVGFYVGETKTHYRVLGGNQRDSVSYAWILKDRLTDCRWPEGVPVPNTGRVRLTANGEPSSVNEA